MRVALLSHNARAGDAIGNQVAEKLRFFLARGADVRVLIESDARLHPDVRPHCWICADLGPEGERWAFLISADLIIVEYGQHFRLLELLPLLAGGRPRILFDYHGVTPSYTWGSQPHEALHQGAAWRGVVWCADAALVHSQFAAQELCGPTGYPTERVCTLGHPIDVDFWRQRTVGERQNERWPAGDAQVLLFVGRLAPNKRVPLLVEALAKLQERTPAVHAVIIGDATDLYALEAERCRRLADELGVANRLHWLGHVRDEQLRMAYRSADVFVMPSVHEGFCIPVLEAMACGLPVVAARAGALPETVGSAGLTFTPDDVDEFAEKIARVLDARLGVAAAPTCSASPPRVAVVAFRYGTDFVGGAEASLRIMAETLKHDGCQVEVFTTCTREEGHWANQYTEGTTTIGGLPVHRFRMDAHDRERHLESARAIFHASGPVAPEVEEEYIRHSIHSSRLLDALRNCLDQFDAILVTPYLHGLAFDVARAFPEKTLLIPCFHDEPFAWLTAVRQTYERVGGVICNSPEERRFMESRLGLNHPGVIVAGTCIDVTVGDAAKGHALVGAGRRYVVYCGRYSPQKGLPPLLEYANRYTHTRPDDFTFVFMGQGDVRVPRASWARDLGFVPENMKRDVLAGADALIQLSPYESLSLVALEAMAQGVPVLGNGRCEAVRGLIDRSGGGRWVDSYEDFEAALNDLREHPMTWQEQGLRGQAFVREHYGDRPALAGRLRQAITELRQPLAHKLCNRAQERVEQFRKETWNERFGELMEGLLDRPPRSVQTRTLVHPRSADISARAGEPTTLLAVQLTNEGAQAEFPDGPARLAVHVRVIDEDGGLQGDHIGAAPSLILPGQSVSAVVPIPVPARCGCYTVQLWATRIDQLTVTDIATVSLSVTEGVGATSCCTPLLAAVQAAIAAAHALQHLPDGYVDVTEGRWGRAKRWLKRKLLNNFKRAYVDVLSHQQSRFNAQVVQAIHDLAESCATLDHAGRVEPSASAADMARRLAELERRVAELEAGRASTTVDLR